MTWFLKTNNDVGQIGEFVYMCFVVGRGLEEFIDLWGLENSNKMVSVRTL